MLYAPGASKKNIFMSYVLSWKQPVLVGFIGTFFWNPMLPCPLVCLSRLLFRTLLSCVTRVNSNKDCRLLFKTSLIFPFLRALPAQFRNVKFSNSFSIFIYWWLLSQQQGCIWQPCWLGLGSSVRATSWWIWPCRLRPGFPCNRLQQRRIAGSSRSFGLFIPFSTNSASHILLWFAICPRHPPRY